MRTTIAAAAAFMLLGTPFLAWAQQAPGLQDYVGTYRYHGGGAVEVIADGDVVTAVLAEAKYPLSATGADAFTNSGGGPVRFERDAAGRVVAVIEGSTRFEKLSADVRPETQNLGDPAGGRSSAVYTPPLDLGDGIAVAGAGSASIDQETAQTLIDGVLSRRFEDVHSMLLYRSGRLVVEEYFYGHDASRPHQLRSATKSFISAAAGGAIADGKLAGVSVNLGDVLRPGGAVAVPPGAAAITIEDLLTMRHGLDCDEDDEGSAGHENGMYGREDWIAFALSIPAVRPRGQDARYCSAAALLVGRAVETVVGEDLPSYARKRLFSPLGVRDGDWSWNFELTPDNTDFAQLRLRPRDMLKFGLLYKDGGTWQGERILPADWVRASLSPQSRVEGQDYGYLWWGQYFEAPTPAGPRRVETWVASGNGGQKIWIVPEFDLIAVFTAGAYNRGNSAPNAMMAQVIVPHLVSKAAP